MPETPGVMNPLSADRGYEPAKCFFVDLVLGGKVMDDPCHRPTGLRVDLVLGQLQISDLRAISVPATGLTQLVTYLVALTNWSAARPYSYKLRRFRYPKTVLTKDGVIAER